MTAPGPLETIVPGRHTVAPWHARMPLRWRLMALVGAGVTALVFGLTWLQVRAIERAVEQQLADTGRLASQAVADDLELAETIDPAEVGRTLHEFLAADPALRAIAVFDVSGAPIQLANTQTTESAVARELAVRVIARGEGESLRRGQLLFAGHPIQRQGATLAVVVSVSLAAVEHARAQGLPIAMAFAGLMLVMLLLLIDIITRRFVHAPLAEISRTMRRVAGGDWDARAQVGSHDEFGVVAAGLNDMVGRLQHFNRDLQARVEEATAQLRRRNQALEDSYQRVLALREALARAERLATVGQMAATVAHEVGTPLNLVSGYVQMMREDEEAGERLRERLAIVDEQISRVTSVLRSMLEHARHPIRRASMPVAPIVARATEIAEPALARSAIQVRTHIDPALPHVDGDEAQIELALLTLIDNALDAMPRGGTLEISVHGRPQGVVIEVGDSGGGIAPEILPRLFEPWVTSKPSDRGTGLGLSIVRDIVRGHGGTIDVQNCPGEGATFSILLPASVQQVSAEAHATDSHR